MPSSTGCRHATEGAVRGDPWKDTILLWQLDDLKDEILEALEQGAAGDGKLIDGRALAVKASPARANSTHLVVGTAALPPSFKTLPHSHEADEIAVFLFLGSSSSTRRRTQLRRKSRITTSTRAIDTLPRIGSSYHAPFVIRMGPLQSGESPEVIRPGRQRALTSAPLARSVNIRRGGSG
jgi:hypothetical protein